MSGSRYILFINQWMNSVTAILKFPKASMITDPDTWAFIALSVQVFIQYK